MPCSSGAQEPWRGHKTRPNSLRTWVDIQTFYLDSFLKLWTMFPHKITFQKKRFLWRECVEIYKRELIYLDRGLGVGMFVCMCLHLCECGCGCMRVGVHKCHALYNSHTDSRQILQPKLPLTQPLLNSSIRHPTCFNNPMSNTIM